VFHYLFTCALLVGSVTYFAQASELGWSAAAQTNGDIRQIFYARYINWAVAFPSIALATGLLSNGSWVTIFTNLFIAWFWVLTYVAAAYTESDYKWGFFAFGTFAWVILAMSTLNEGRESANRLGIGRDYILLAGYTNMLWVLYPVAFGLGDGGNRIGVTAGSIFVGVLDVLMIPVLTFAFVLLGRQWNFGRLHLDLSEHRYNPVVKSEETNRNAPSAE
jgi:bacteriorhodopsin